MFTPQRREQVKSALIGRAHSEERITAAALLGSSSTATEDPWSDIDLALCIDADEIDTAIADWTGMMYEHYDAVHHFDVRWETTLYRVFLLEDTLQVDLSFWAIGEFVAYGPSFKLLFGSKPAQRVQNQRPAEAIVGEAWLYLLHARSSLARGRNWQADYMIARTRDRVLELACRRHDLRTDDARAVDDLPAALLADYASMVPRTLGEREQREALRATTFRLIAEARESHPDFTERIAGTLERIGSRDD